VVIVTEKHRRDLLQSLQTRGSEGSYTGSARFSKATDDLGGPSTFERLRRPVPSEITPGLR
jgi:hypothetical protein